MSLLALYRLSLHLLPPGLRRKHGASMVLLFSREVDSARCHGPGRALLVGAAAIGDVVTRAVYEQIRPVLGAAGPASTVHPHEEAFRMVGPAAPLPTTKTLIARLARSFGIAAAVLTVVMLAMFASGQIPALLDRDAGGGTLLRALLLSVPFLAVMTIPMAVLISVMHVFTRLGADGILTRAKQVRHGVRRLVMPVVVASTVVAMMALTLTTQILPVANAQLTIVLRGGDGAQNDRSMSVTQLRAAARNAARDAAKDVALTALGSTDTQPELRAQQSERYAAVASLEVEIHKKFALPAACVVLALAAMAIAWSVPRGGTPLLLGASLSLVALYYVMLMAGETLAERLVVSPMVAMWGANGVVLLLATILAWLAGVRRGAQNGRMAQI